MIQIIVWTLDKGCWHHVGMDTTISKSWHWQATDRSRNIAREYHLWIQTDLFGWTTVERRWGRIGSKGQGITLSFPEREQGEAMARKVRDRRTSAIKRIGVAYREITEARKDNSECAEPTKTATDIRPPRPKKVAQRRPRAGQGRGGRAVQSPPVSREEIRLL